jgi:CRP-like cAMP-binding protein
MGRWFDLRSGMTLVGEGDPGYSFFVVVRGQVRITRKGRCSPSAARANASRSRRSC